MPDTTQDTIFYLEDARYYRQESILHNTAGRTVPDLGVFRDCLAQQNNAQI